MGNVVIGHHVASQICSARIEDVGGRRAWHRQALKLTGPDVGQVSVLVAEDPVIFITKAQVERELVADLPIILEEGILVRQAVAVNQAAGTAARAKEALHDLTVWIAGGAAGVSRIARRIARCASTLTDHEVGEGRKNNQAAQQTAERDVPLRLLIFIAGAESMPSMRPGNLVGDLHLRGRAVRRRQGTTDRLACISNDERSHFRLLWNDRRNSQ